MVPEADPMEVVVAEAATVVVVDVEETVAGVVMELVHQAPAATTTATIVENQATGRMTVATSSPRRRSGLLQPKNRSQVSYSPHSTQ
jgi:hypothetical protein